MTLSVPEKLHKEMTIHTEIKWSDVARQAFEKKVTELHWMDKKLQKSKLTEQDVDEISHNIKHEMRKRFSARNLLLTPMFSSQLFSKTLHLDGFSLTLMRNFSRLV